MPNHIAKVDADAKWGNNHDSPANLVPYVQVIDQSCMAQEKVEKDQHEELVALFYPMGTLSVQRPQQAVHGYQYDRAVVNVGDLHE